MGFNLGKLVGAAGTLFGGGQQQQPQGNSMLQALMGSYQGRVADRRRRSAQTPNLLSALQSLVRPQAAQNVSTQPEPTTRRPQVSTRGNGRVGAY